MGRPTPHMHQGTGSPFGLASDCQQDGRLQYCPPRTLLPQSVTQADSLASLPSCAGTRSSVSGDLMSYGTLDFQKPQHGAAEAWVLWHTGWEPRGGGGPEALWGLMVIRGLKYRLLTLSPNAAAAHRQDQKMCIMRF